MRARSRERAARKAALVGSALVGSVRGLSALRASVRVDRAALAALRDVEVVHVAALPFPSSQGTQAAVLAVVRDAAHASAARASGGRVGLVTYEAGDGRDVLPANVVHVRTKAPVANRSLRSGPSLAKVAEDAVLVRVLASLRPSASRGRAPRVVAHHVEAGFACVLAGVPFTWVAHTALGPELPLYAPGSPRLGRLASRLGEQLDAFVARRAERVLAVSPFLAARLRAELGIEADVLPIPWPPAAPDPKGARQAGRARARAALGLLATDEVVLYAGNLDHYQGLDTALAALAQLVDGRPRLRFLVATQSSPDAFLALARTLAAGSSLAERIVLAPLADDADRVRAHHAADLALVPRRLEAGLSIKILEALAHALPVVAVRAATGGHVFDGSVVLVDDEARAVADAVARSFDVDGFGFEPIESQSIEPRG